VVAVSSGDGLSELFGQLGVQGVVTGGQTLNPSTAELLSAVEAVNAQQVIVLPNNKNIIPVAEQLDALTSKTVVVVPTRSMPEALAALVLYDPEADASTNGQEMGEAAASVATGEVTRAVRATGSDAGPINEGDWIGIISGVSTSTTTKGIVAVSGSLDGATVALLDRLVQDGSEIVTVVEGTEATPGHTDVIQAWLDENRPGVQVEVHRGAQPLYPYLFGVE
jgi:dihydroxyacetone kinase-like predicted kinase